MTCLGTMNGEAAIPDVQRRAAEPTWDLGEDPSTDPSCLRWPVWGRGAAIAPAEQVPSQEGCKRGDTPLLFCSLLENGLHTVSPHHVSRKGLC